MCTFTLRHNLSACLHMSSDDLWMISLFCIACAWTMFYTVLKCTQYSYHHFYRILRLAELIPSDSVSKCPPFAQWSREQTLVIPPAAVSIWLAPVPEQGPNIQWAGVALSSSLFGTWNSKTSANKSTHSRKHLFPNTQISPPVSA